MNQALGLFPSAHLLFLSLAGGRAPRSWQRELRQATAQVASLRLAGAWIESLVSLRPTLWEGPLLGHCLSSLAAEVAGTAGAKSEVARSRPPRSLALRELPAAKRRPTSNADKSVQRSGPMPAPVLPDKVQRQSVSAHLTELPLRVGRELLCRLIGEPAPSFCTEPSRSDVIAPSSDGHHYKNPAPQAKSRSNVVPFDVRQPYGAQTDGSRRRRAELVGQVHEGHDRLAWQRQLMRRVTNVIFGSDPCATTMATYVEESLGQQWSSPISGSEAPTELLSALAGLARQGERARSRDEDGTRSPSRPDGQSQVVPLAAGSTDGLSNGMIEPGLSRSGRQEGLPPFSTDGDQRARNSARTDFEMMEQIAPPAVAPSLPPLIPPQTVGEPLLPIAAATARQGARAEAQEAEEDLDILAAKIKLILDEQARRHGIDV